MIIETSAWIGSSGIIKHEPEETSSTEIILSLPVNSVSIVSLKSTALPLGTKRSWIEVTFNGPEEEDSNLFPEIQLESDKSFVKQISKGA